MNICFLQVVIVVRLFILLESYDYNTGTWIFHAQVYHIKENYRVLRPDFIGIEGSPAFAFHQFYSNQIYWLV